MRIGITRVLSKPSGPQQQITRIESNRKFSSNDLLRKYEGNDSIVVQTVDVKPAVAKGNNFASIVSRVLIQGIKVENNNKTSEYEISLITKQLVKNKELLETYHFDVIFGNESEAYNIIIPTLSKCCPTGRLNMAECLLATKDIVVLKDLAQDGYKNLDKTKDFQLDEVKLTLTELAKLHATSFVLRQKDPEKLDFLGTLTQEIVFSKKNNEFLQLQKLNFDLAIHIFQGMDATSQNLKAIEVLEDIKENAMERQVELITNNRKHKVINHGDTWGNNILFKDDSVILIDLQIMRYASVAADLGYFLYINMQPAMRRDNHKVLLQHYLDVLHEQLLACGVDLRSELTKEWLWQEMDDFALLGLTCALWILPIFHYDMSDFDFENYNWEEWNKLEWHIERMTDGFKNRAVELVQEYVKNNVD